MMQISKSTLQFLEELKQNNSREWFEGNKSRYKDLREGFKAFAQEVEVGMGQYDEIEKTKLFRIHRDVRFSKDKSPYKTCFSGYLVRATKRRRGGLYFHIEPGNCFVGGGFWAPESKDLARIRQDIAADDKPLRDIIAAPAFQKHFGSLMGDQLKTAPKGYAKDHPAVDLLRFKQYLVMEQFTDKQATAEGYAAKILESFRVMLPFLDYMSEVLTTDANGQPLEDLT